MRSCFDANRCVDMQKSSDSEPEISAWQLERRDVDRMIYGFLLHTTVERYRPCIFELRPPISQNELALIGRRLRPWVRDWLSKAVPPKSYELEFGKHIRTAKNLLLEILAKDRSTHLLRWLKYCWPYYIGFPGEGTWAGLLYHLCYFEKRYARLPSQLFRGRALRERVEHFYLEFERSKDDFERRLKRHSRSPNPATKWERFLAQDVAMRKYLKDPYRIAEAYEHLAFCKLWKRLNAELSMNELKVLKDWLIHEAEGSIFSAVSLDAVNCKCLSFYKE